MRLYNNTTYIISEAIKGDKDSLETLSEGLHRASSHKVGFWSKRVPDSDSITYIAFYSLGSDVYFYAEAGDNVYTRLVDKDDVAEFVFTPAVFDLDHATLALPSDIKNRG